MTEPTSVRDLFPRSAGRIWVASAWRAADSTLAEPTGYGSDGWTHVGRPATRDVLQDLRGQGFTHVALRPTRTVNRRSPVRIESLLR
jgi:hypothetical protein